MDNINYKFNPMPTSVIPKKYLARRQHYVPRCFIKMFGESFYSFNLITETISHNKIFPSDIAYEIDFYELWKLDNEYSDEYRLMENISEKSLSNYDNFIKKTIDRVSKKIKNQENITKNDLDNISYVLLNLLIRSKYFFEKNEFIQEIQYSDEAIKFAKGIFYMLTFDCNNREKHPLNNTAKKIAIETISFFFIKSTKEEFIFNDGLFFKIGQNENDDNFYGIPLSSELLLVFTLNNKANYRKIRKRVYILSDEEIIKINLKMFNKSIGKYIYCPDLNKIKYYSFLYQNKNNELRAERY